MASDSDPELATATKDAKRSKKDKKSSKRSEADGVHKDKKDRKKDKHSTEKLANALDAHLQAEVAAEAAADESKRRRKEEKAAKRKQKTDDVDMEGEDDPAEGKTSAEGALVYFAYPMADEKMHKKAFKLIKKGAKIRAIHRGVKECEKAIKKSPVLQFNPESPSNVPAVLIIAGDISPPEVIEHFPIHCEEHNVPYIFVRSRAELGVAACTKRATSVVLVKPDGKGPAAPKDGVADAEKEVKVDPAEFKEAWTELVKLAQKEYGKQVMPFIQREKRGL